MSTSSAWSGFKDSPPIHTVAIQWTKACNNWPRIAPHESSLSISAPILLLRFPLFVSPLPRFLQLPCREVSLPSLPAGRILFRPGKIASLEDIYRIPAVVCGGTRGKWRGGKSRDRWGKRRRTTGHGCWMKESNCLLYSNSEASRAIVSPNEENGQSKGSVQKACSCQNLPSTYPSLLHFLRLRSLGLQPSSYSWLLKRSSKLMSPYPCPFLLDCLNLKGQTAVGSKKYNRRRLGLWPKAAIMNQMKERDCPSRKFIS